MLLILLVVIVVIGVLMFNRRKGFASNGEVFSLAEMLQGSLFKLSLECEEIPMLEVSSQISKKESKRSCSG